MYQDLWILHPSHTRGHLHIQKFEDLSPVTCLVQLWVSFTFSDLYDILHLFRSWLHSGTTTELSPGIYSRLHSGVTQLQLINCVTPQTLTWWTLDLLSSSGVNASVYKSYSSSSSATSFQISQRTTDMQACRLVIVHTAEDVDTEKPVLIFTLAPLHYCVSVSTSIQPFRGILGCFTKSLATRV